MSQPDQIRGRWFHRFGTGTGTSVRLYCFPHAGGSASFFFPMARTLGAAVTVVGIQYPGRQDRRLEPAIDNVPELAERIATALGDEHAQRCALPTVFFGHSMGAIVAFEAARLLEVTGGGPQLLMVSGRRAPSTHRDESVHTLDDAGVVEEMRKLAGTEASMLDDAELLNMILPAIRSDYRAVETYRAVPDAVVRCPISVLVGNADPRVTLDEARAWRRHTRGDFRFHTFPGGHFYLSERPAEVISTIATELATLQENIGVTGDGEH